VEARLLAAAEAALAELGAAAATKPGLLDKELRSALLWR
jgi:hypothetical protein